MRWPRVWVSIWANRSAQPRLNFPIGVPHLSPLWGFYGLTRPVGAIFLLTVGCAAHLAVGLFTQEPVRTLLSPSSRGFSETRGISLFTVLLAYLWWCRKRRVKRRLATRSQNVGSKILISWMAILRLPINFLPRASQLVERAVSIVIKDSKFVH